jgi:Tol biopolymer transport system component
MRENWRVSGSPLLRVLKPRVLILVVALAALVVGVGGADATAAGSGEFAFIEERDSGMATDLSAVLWVVKTDGTNLRHLTDPFPCVDCAEAPRFSPDGENVAYSGGDFTDGGVGVVGADGRQMRSAHCSTCEEFPVWSSDGTRIASTNRDGGIVVFDYPSGQHRRNVPNATDLSYGADPSLDWSRDGSKFAYVDESRRLHVINSDGKSGRILYRDAAAPRFSPDGKTIAFYNAHGVYLIPAGGGQVRRIADGGPAAWSSDGERIAVMNDGPSITILDIETGHRQVVRLPFGTCKFSTAGWCQDLDWHN